MTAQLEAQYPYPPVHADWQARPVLQYEQHREHAGYYSELEPELESSLSAGAGVGLEDDARRYSVASSQSYCSGDMHYQGIPYSPLDPRDPTSVAYDRQRADRRGSLPPMRPYGASPVVRRLVSYPASASYRRNSCAVPQAFHEPEQRLSVCSLTTTTTSGSEQQAAVEGDWQHLPLHVPAASWMRTACLPEPAVVSAPAPVPVSAQAPAQTIDNPSEAFHSWIPHTAAPSSDSASAPPTTTERRGSFSSTCADALSYPGDETPHTFYRRNHERVRERQLTPYEIVGVDNTAEIPKSIPECMVTWTTDADVKQTITTRRLCFNCQAKTPPSWRKSVLFVGRILCNKCGIYERTHKKPRPFQSDEDKLRKSTIIQSTLRKPAFSSSSSSSATGMGLGLGLGAVAEPSWARSHARQSVQGSYSPELETASSHYSSLPTPTFSLPASPFPESYPASSYDGLTPGPGPGPAPEASFSFKPSPEGILQRGFRGARSVAEPYARAYVGRSASAGGARRDESADLSYYLPYYRAGVTREAGLRPQQTKAYGHGHGHGR